MQPLQPIHPIRSFDDLTAHLRQMGRRIRLAVVCGSDNSTIAAVTRAVNEGFAEVVFVGDCEQVRAQAPVAALQAEYVHYVTAESHEQAAMLAVQMVRDRRADVLVKGLLHTATLLRAVLNKEWGILPQGKVLTHIAMAEIPAYRKLLFFTDAAVIPYPIHEQRLAQVAYLAETLHAFAVEQPKIALLHCAETVSEKFPHTLGYGEICQRAAAGEWGNLIVDGPLDLKTSCDQHAMQVKGIKSPINGHADALIFPNIQTGNVFYKTITLFCNATTAAILQGTHVPVVLPSRGDSPETKFNSIALACAI